jgi:type VI secretion system protein VasD
MSITVFKLLRIAAIAVPLSGCGVVQNVSDSTASATRSVFYKQVKTLHLDLDGRVALNTHSTDMNALSVPTVVRVYQLREGSSMTRATYNELLSDADHVLGADLLTQHSVVVKPGEGVQLSVPLVNDAVAVAVVALFREPDLESDSWRLVLGREDLDPDKARVVELGDNRLTLRPLARG